MITIENVRKVFNAGRPNELVAVHEASLSIGASKVTVLKGPSGSGKTTLLSVIGCMSRPTAGRIRLGDREITSLPERFLTMVRRETFGFIFQQFNLIRGITALENVMVPAYPLGMKHSLLRERAMQLIGMFGLEGRAGSRAEWLSGGEAQRVAIARALINNPSVIIADEPTAHLDTKLSREFMEIMESLHKEGRTIIIASHDPIVYESPFVDRTVSMRDGRIEGSVSI
jgi:putative ABC transport system ATP-binding protein